MKDRNVINEVKRNSRMFFERGEEIASERTTVETHRTIAERRRASKNEVFSIRKSIRNRSEVFKKPGRRRKKPKKKIGTFSVRTFE
jgi:hypothetical protein